MEKRKNKVIKAITVTYVPMQKTRLAIHVKKMEITEIGEDHVIVKNLNVCYKRICDCKNIGKEIKDTVNEIRKKEGNIPVFSNFFGVNKKHSAMYKVQHYNIDNSYYLKERGYIEDIDVNEFLKCVNI